MPSALNVYSSMSLYMLLVIENVSYIYYSHLMSKFISLLVRSSWSSIYFYMFFMFPTVAYCCLLGSAVFVGLELHSSTYFDTFDNFHSFGA